jgi:hypothetical protein
MRDYNEPKYQAKYEKYYRKYKQLAGHGSSDCHCISCLWRSKGEKKNGASCDCDCDCASNLCDYKMFSLSCGVCRDKANIFKF